MKSIFTKLGTLLLCGAVAMVGCSDFSADLRDVNERLEDLQGAAATKTEMTQLKAEVETLSKKLSESYATKDDVTKVSDAIEAIEDALTAAEIEFKAALENKADKTALDQAVANLKDMLDQASKNIEGVLADLTTENTNLKNKVELLNTEVTTLLTDVQGLKTDLAEVAGDLTLLQGQVKDLKDDCADYQTKTDEAIKDIQTTLKNNAKTVNDEFDAIKGQIEKLATSDALASEVAKLEGLISNVNLALEAKAKKLEDADKALEDALTELTEGYNAFVENTDKEFIEIKDQIDDLVSVVTDKYDELSDRIDAIEDLLFALEDKVEDIGTELRSMVSIPQMMLNGMNAVEFKSLVFVPMLQDSDVVTVAEGAAEYELVPASAYVYYHFNPSKFDIDNAYYTAVGENVEFITKAETEEVVTVGKVTEENGRVKVEFFRGKGEGNVFALAATLYENENVIYSDYVQIIDNYFTADDFEIVNTNNETLYATLEEAQNGAYTAQMNVGETHSVGEHIEVAGADIAQFGLKLKYTLVSGKAQISAEGEFNAPEAALGTDNIVKIELVDEHNCVVRRAYIKIRVVGPAVYYQATATASVAAQRVAFEIADIQVWAQLLKDEPDTKNRISQAFEAIMAMDFLTAYELLNGVPGFVKKNTTFTVTVKEKVKMESTLSGTVNSLLPEIKLIDSVEDFTVAVKKLETKFEESALSKLNVELIATFIPQINDLPVVSNILEQILKFRFSSVLENNLVTGILKTIEKYIDFQGIRNRLFEIAEEIESSTNINTSATAEAVAKSAAIAKAEAQSVIALMEKIAETNEQVVIDVNEGNWGKLLSLVDNKVVAKIFEVLQLTDVYNTLMDIAGYAESLAQWTYNPLAITAAADPNVERLDVIE